MSEAKGIINAGLPYGATHGKNSARLRKLLLGASSLAFVANMPAAHAFSVYNGTVGGQDMEVNLDTTAEYSNIFRVNNPSQVLAGPTDPNSNDGDSNFPHGLVDNTFDVAPIFDLKWGTWGVHVSGEAFLDTPYLGTNANSQPSTFNPYTTVDNKHFTSATRNINGENAILLDAFVSKNFNFGDQSASLRVGRQTLLWGQSLLFTGNGVAAGQAPLDTNKALSQPGALAEQIFLPVGQVVGSYQPNQTLTLQAYYQFEWEPDTFETPGSYFSFEDLLDKGGQRVIFGSTNAVSAYRGKDNRPTHNGQFGASAQFTVGDYDIGLYALRYDSKTPQLYLGLPSKGQPTGSVGTYYLVYPRDIAIYGTSLSTDIGSANVGAEASVRTNMPLVSGVGLLFNPATLAPVAANANNRPLYAVGDTFHTQASIIDITPAIPLDPGGVAIDGEVEFNHVLSVTKNASALVEHRDPGAAAAAIFVTPQYYNVFPNVEIELPLTLSYNFYNNSQIDPSMNHGTGTYSVGVRGVYKGNWTANVLYQGYLGAPNTVTNALADRGFVAFNVEHTF